MAIAGSGTDFRILFLDGSAITLTLKPTTTVAQACARIAKELDIPFDPDFTLYDFTEGFFTCLEDTAVLQDVISSWKDESSSNLYYKRKMYLTKNKTEDLIKEAKSPEESLLRLRLIEDAYEFHAGNHRHSVDNIAKLAALLIKASNPEDQQVSVTGVMVDAICPPFVLTDSQHNENVMGRLEDSKSCAEFAKRVEDELKGLGGVDTLEAMKSFCKLSTEATGYGSEYILAKRTKKGANDKKVDSTKDVTVGVGEVGIHLLDMNEPTQVDTHTYEVITRWTVSKDNKIFAYILDSGDTEYLVADQAAAIEKTVDRYIAQLMSEKDADSANPRSVPEADMPAFVSFTPPPVPPFVVSGKGLQLILGAKKTPTPGGGVGITPNNDEESKERSASNLNASVSPKAEEEKSPKGTKSATEGGAAEAGEKELPEGWVESEEDGKTFYLHEASGLWQYEHPADGIMLELPEGWAEGEEDGKTFYLFEETGEWQYEHPALTEAVAEEGVEEEKELPEGWTMYEDENGEYFYEHEDGTQQYEFPEE